METNIHAAATDNRIVGNRQRSRSEVTYGQIVGHVPLTDRVPDDYWTASTATAADTAGVTGYSSSVFYGHGPVVMMSDVKMTAGIPRGPLVGNRYVAGVSCHTANIAASAGDGTAFTDRQSGRHIAAAAADNDLNQTIDYSQIANKITEHIESNQFLLLENAACDIADICLDHTIVKWVRIHIKKPAAIANAKCSYITIERP